LRGSQDVGSPHSNDPEKKWGAVGRGRPEWWSPVIWILMKRVLRAVKPRGEGLVLNDIKPYEI